LQGCGPKGKLRSEGKCEGMNLHTSKGAFTLCYNLSLRLATKARSCKVAGQKGSLRVKESVRE